MPPLRASPSMPISSTTCDCRAAARRLSQHGDDNPTQPHNSVPSSVSFSSQNTSFSSPSAALLQGRAITARWTHLSTTCPNSPFHLTSPSILRAMTTALERVTTNYEIHLWKMVFVKTTGSGTGTGTNPNLVPNLYPGRQGSSASMTGHIGVYELEEDETQILVQEALRTSVEELGGVLSEIQKKVGLIRGESMLLTGIYPGVDSGHVGHLLGSTGIGQIRGDGSGLYDTRGNGTSLDGEFGREMDGANHGEQQEMTQVTLPTDEEMGEINVRLYGCLRRLDFLETGEVG